MITIKPIAEIGSVSRRAFHSGPCASCEGEATHVMIIKRDEGALRFVTRICDDCLRTLEHASWGAATAVDIMEWASRVDRKRRLELCAAHRSLMILVMTHPTGLTWRSSHPTDFDGALPGAWSTFPYLLTVHLFEMRDLGVIALTPTNPDVGRQVYQVTQGEHFTEVTDVLFKIRITMDDDP